MRREPLSAWASMHMLMNPFPCHPDTSLHELPSHVFRMFKIKITAHILVAFIYPEVCITLMHNYNILIVFFSIAPY